MDSGANKKPAMTFVKMQHCATTACALGLLLIASPGDAQTVAAAIKEFTMGRRAELRG